MNLESKKLNREQMKSVLGGYVDMPHCIGNSQCSKGYYCDIPEGSLKGGTCVKEEPQSTFTVSSLITIK